MKKIKLTKYEQEIEDAIDKGELVPVSRQEFDEIAQLLAQRRKDAVLNIRINSQDLAAIKEKARKMGVKYQTFIAEMLHRVAAG